MVQTKPTQKTGTLIKVCVFWGMFSYVLFTLVSWGVFIFYASVGKSYQKTTATISSVFSQNVSRNNSSLTYNVVYEYDSKSYTGHVTTSNYLLPGNTIEIYVNTKDPTTIYDMKPTTSMYIWLGAGFLTTLILIIASYFAYYHPEGFCAWSVISWFTNI